MNFEHTIYGEDAKAIAKTLEGKESTKINDERIYDTNTKVYFTVRSVEGRTVVDVEMNI